MRLDWITNREGKSFVHKIDTPSFSTRELPRLWRGASSVLPSARHLPRGAARRGGTKARNMIGLWRARGTCDERSRSTASGREEQGGRGCCAAGRCAGRPPRASACSCRCFEGVHRAPRSDPVPRSRSSLQTSPGGCSAGEVAHRQVRRRRHLDGTRPHPSEQVTPPSVHTTRTACVRSSRARPNVGRSRCRIFGARFAFPGSLLRVLQGPGKVAGTSHQPSVVSYAKLRVLAEG